MAQHSHEHTTASTYSSKGDVRRGLDAAGFKTARQEGHGHKRHMLVANGVELSRAQTSFSDTTPWFTLPKQSTNHDEVAVIGAGLAGANVANALARRNYRVTVFDSSNEIASGASGISQLALRCRLFNEVNIHAEFFLQAYLYASRHYGSLTDSIAGTNSAWHPSGVLQLRDAMNKKLALNGDRIFSIYPNKVVSKATADRLRGIHENLLQEALWFSQGGWADARELCQILLESPGTTTYVNVTIDKLERHGHSWKLIDRGGNVVANVPVVVVATGHELTALQQAERLPLDCSVGQSTQVNVSAFDPIQQLPHVVSGTRSIFPSYNDMHTVSASYRPIHRKNLHDTNDDRSNIQAAKQLFRDSEMASFTHQSSSLAIRANTPDRMPIVGPVPVYEPWQINIERYNVMLSANLLKVVLTIKAYTYQQGTVLRGLTTTPLAGEYLASLIDGGSLPVSDEMMNALNPSRFLIRDLKKQK